MLKIHNLNFSFENNIILENFSCEMKRGERVCISAPSGRGKTTLLRIISGLQNGYEGNVEIESDKLSVVFQDDVLLPWYTAEENVAVVSSKEKALHWLKKLSLSDSADKYPRELSGGMKRRVALCRALAYDGDVLILDEAFKGLDYNLKREIIEIIKEECKDRLIIFTSHDKEETDMLATRIITL